MDRGWFRISGFVTKLFLSFSRFVDKNEIFRWRMILLSFVPSINILISISDPWRAIWADSVPFKGSQLCPRMLLQELKRYHEGCVTLGPKTPSTNVHTTFYKNPQLWKTIISGRIELVARPAGWHRDDIGDDVDGQLLSSPAGAEGGHQRSVVAFLGGLDITDGRYDSLDFPLWSTLQTLHQGDFYQNCVQEVIFQGFFKNNMYPTTIIIGDLWNTAFDTDCLKSRHGQMSYLKMATLVCPVSMWPGPGLYAELFWIGALNGLHR